MQVIINPIIFRKNDIRGKVPEDLNPQVIELIGKSFTSFVSKKLNKDPEELLVSIGYDVRLHSPQIAENLCKGLTESGVKVLNLGRCPTPVVYFSSFYKIDQLDIPNASIMITGSHNPPDYNGLKFTINENCLKEEDILLIKQNIVLNNFVSSKNRGNVLSYNLIPDYINFLKIQFEKVSTFKQSLKIVIDSGNGCAGEIVPDLLRLLNCDIIELYSEPDGTFPNHHPDPTIPENLTTLINIVKENNADFGVAYDGDADRIGIVDDKGNIIAGDMLMLLYAMDILQEKRYQDPTFIAEVKCSQVLYDTLAGTGARTIMWKTGHSFIKDKMKEENALLAGEMSGHIFFADKYFGFDDAIYATCRLVEYIVKNKNKDSQFSLSQDIKRFPATYATPEIRIKSSDEEKFEIVEKLKELLEKERINNNNIKDIIDVDGVRIVFDDGFGLVRASNTEPILVLRFESNSKSNLLMTEQYIYNLLNAVTKKVHIENKVNI